MAMAATVTVAVLVTSHRNHALALGVVRYELREERVPMLLQYMRGPYSLVPLVLAAGPQLGAGQDA